MQKALSLGLFSGELIFDVEGILRFKMGCV